MTTHHFLLCKCHLQIKLIKLIFNCKCCLQLKTNYKNQSQMTVFVLAIKFMVTISRLIFFQGYKKTQSQKWHILYLLIFKE